MSEKIVYILGAGFSMNAGAPSQAGLIQEIYNLKKTYTKSSQAKVQNWVDKFDQFLKHTLQVTEAEKQHYTLEDVFTPIDRCISENISFRQHTPKALTELRDIFNRLIILAVRSAIENSKKKQDSITTFAKHIISLSKARLTNEKEDNVSVITTNWDIMLDNSVHTLMSKEPKPKGLKFSGVVDYCCYISSLDKNDDSIKPGLYAIGKGRYNTKILKLHGSLNWMQCPRCQRLYVKFYQKWNGGYVFDEKYCRHCDTNFGVKSEEANLLSTNLIMPTFLKNLNNVQNKLIWQNAGIELSEASKIVFLGYSLPQADFEFKQLLSRMIRKDAKIEAVLVTRDNPKAYDDNDPAKYQTAGYRFENFFSGRSINILYDGVDDYITKYCR
jgi:NAD-dependent SIR2 family protein deacetylase